ncbi:unnamed protein product [Ectocarpus sp. CCAP 1310/34]|nr:unnamed protein product [Ectocarpus sp. CCAP 1310/34]
MCKIGTPSECTALRRRTHPIPHEIAPQRLHPPRTRRADPLQPFFPCSTT